MKKMVKTAALIAVLTAGMTLGSVNAYATTVRIGGSSSQTQSGSGSGAGSSRTNVIQGGTGSSSSGGPGAGSGSSTQTQVTENTDFQGPKLNVVSLAESYHDDFDVYELSLNNSWFFYSNVGNGSITNQGVYLDLPAGLSYVMEKDGVEIPYSSRQIVREYGSYTVTLTAANDASLPFSEQEIYQAVFRFRIQEKPVNADESASGSGPSGSAGGYISYEEAMNMVNDAVQAAMGSGAWMPETTASDESAPETAPEVMGDDGKVNSTSLDQAIEDAINTGYDYNNIEGFNPANGMASSYNMGNGYYRHELATEAVFYTNVPNGMLTNNSVTLLTNDPIEFRVLKDGQEMEYVPGGQITEDGSYLVYPSQTSTLYISSYANMDEPVFQFRIVGGIANDIGVFNAPAGTEIIGVKRDGVDLPYEQISGGYLYLGEDGAYQISLQTEAGISTVSFTRDTLAPRFSVAMVDHEAHFYYQSTDAERCVITQDGEEVFSGGLVSVIKDPGDYAIEVYDAAGNVSRVSISVPYRMNTGAILAIVLVVLLVIAGIIFVRRLSRQLKV